MIRYGIISIRADLAEAIMAGTKTVEVRRRRMRIGNDIFAVYASGPAGRAIVGCVAPNPPVRIGVEDLIALSADDQGITLCHVGISADELRDYAEGLSHVWAMTFRWVERIDRPVPLEVLRRRVTGFRPPQSWQWWDGQWRDLVRDPDSEEVER